MGGRPPPSLGHSVPVWNMSFGLEELETPSSSDILRFPLFVGTSRLSNEVLGKPPKQSSCSLIHKIGMLPEAACQLEGDFHPNTPFAAGFLGPPQR